MIAGVFLLSFIFGCSFRKDNANHPDEQAAITYENLMKEWKENAHADEMVCWYTEASDKEWLTGMAEDFRKEYGIQVDLVYYDGVSFYEDMNTANQKGNGPDVYMCGNDQLELVRNSGLAEENTIYNETFWKENYPEIAKRAVTFKGKQYGYPVYFDTYCLVYDAKLLETAPASMDDILTFADEYSDTGATKAILRWDVADPYINTMFLAAYADLFGKEGDDAQSFQIYNRKTVETMTYFNSISEYMWMDKNNISHDIVKNRIKEGTLVLGLCKTDVLGVLEEANHLDEVEYKISYMPSLTSELLSKPYSTTYIAMVNPYAKDESLANMFACYLSLGNPKGQFEENGKLPVVDEKDMMDENQSVIYAQYVNSTPVPKVMVFGDYISESAITFDAIWDGKDVDEQLSHLQNRMEEKIN